MTEPTLNLRENAESGPSNQRMTIPTLLNEDDAHDVNPEDELISITSTGLDYFHYRRALFLAGEKIPTITRSTKEIPLTIKVKRPPPPLSLSSVTKVTNRNVDRLEKALRKPGAEEDQAVWESGLEAVWNRLNSGKKLKIGLRLGLVIKILRAGWLQDGTWPVHPVTNKAIPPPDSPLIPSPEIPIDPFAQDATP